MKSQLLAITFVVASLSAQAGETIPTMGQIANFDDPQVTLKVFEFMPEPGSSIASLKIANRSSRSVEIKGKFGSPVFAPGSSGTIPCVSDYLNLSVHVVDSQNADAVAYLIPTCGSELVVIENPKLIDTKSDEVSGEGE